MQGANTALGVLVAFVGTAAYQAAASPPVPQGKPGLLGVLIPSTCVLISQWQLSAILFLLTIPKRFPYIF